MFSRRWLCQAHCGLWHFWLHYGHTCSPQCELSAAPCVQTLTLADSVYFGHPLALRFAWLQGLTSEIQWESAPQCAQSLSLQIWLSSSQLADFSLLAVQPVSSQHTTLHPRHADLFADWNEKMRVPDTDLMPSNTRLEISGPLKS